MLSLIYHEFSTAKTNFAPLRVFLHPYIRRFKNRYQPQKTAAERLLFLTKFALRNVKFATFYILT